jgi:hypothetical protein
MNEIGYRAFLEGEGLTGKAIDSRVTRLNRVIKEFKVNIDTIVTSDERMLQLRDRIYTIYNTGGSSAGNLYNAVTKYYKFMNGKEMKRINSI